MHRLPIAPCAMVMIATFYSVEIDGFLKWRRVPNPAAGLAACVYLPSEEESVDAASAPPPKLLKG